MCQDPEQLLKDDPGYDAWTLDYWRESVVTMEKDTLWDEIYQPETETDNEH